MAQTATETATRTVRNESHGKGLKRVLMWRAGQRKKAWAAAQRRNTFFAPPRCAQRALVSAYTAILVYPPCVRVPSRPVSCIARTQTSASIPVGPHPRIPRHVAVLLRIVRRIPTHTVFRWSGPQAQPLQAPHSMDRGGVRTPCSPCRRARLGSQRSPTTSSRQITSSR